MSSHSSRPGRGPSLTSKMHRLEVAVNLAVLARLKAAGFDKVRPSHVAFVDQMGDGCRMSVLAKRLNLTPGR